MKLHHHDPLKQAVPDAMHTIKDVVANLFGLIVGQKDGDKVRKAERNLGRLPTSSASTRRSASTVPYCLTKEQCKLADDRMRCIRVPIHIDFRPKCIFVKFGYMKSHDWKQVYMCEALDYPLRCDSDMQCRQCCFVS